MSHATTACVKPRARPTRIMSAVFVLAVLLTVASCTAPESTDGRRESVFAPTTRVEPASSALSNVERDAPGLHVLSGVPHPAQHSTISGTDTRAAREQPHRPRLGRIMFASNRGGTFDLYSVNEDGTDVQLVIGGPRDELHPDISPDGKRIAFVRAEDAARPFGASCCGPFVDLFTASWDGGDVTPLLPHPVLDDYRPDWAPDGKRIAFSRAVAIGASNIFTVEPGGTGLRQVTTGPAGNNVASWSPDGKQLVFVSTREGRIRLWVTDADGGNPHPITDGLPNAIDTSPQWSPAGDRIVFGSDRDGGASELYTVRPDGRELTRITTSGVSDSYATWSPDGTRIAVSRGSASGGAIWVMNADGSNQRQITDGPFDTFPVYFPDRPSPGGGRR